jgi:outer membrane murein-binding lipoprotein Lpp
MKTNTLTTIAAAVAATLLGGCVSPARLAMADAREQQRYCATVPSSQWRHVQAASMMAAGMVPAPCAGEQP